MVRKRKNDNIPLNPGQPLANQFEDECKYCSHKVEDKARIANVNMTINMPGQLYCSEHDHMFIIKDLKNSPIFCTLGRLVFDETYYDSDDGE